MCEKISLNAQEWLRWEIKQRSKKLHWRVTGCPGECYFSFVKMNLITSHWSRLSKELDVKGGSQWHLTILISALVAGQVPTEPRTLLEWASGEKKTLLHFLIDKIRIPLAVSKKFRQPKKEQHLSQTRAVGAECGVWLECNWGFHMCWKHRWNTIWVWACARSRFHKSHVFNLILSGSGLGDLNIPDTTVNTFIFKAYVGNYLCFLCSSKMVSFIWEGFVSFGFHGK